MNKILVLLILPLLLFIGSCHLSQASKVNKLNDTVIKKVEEQTIKDVEEGKLTYQELVISQRLVYFISPLILSTFVSIVLITLGSRLWGLGLLTSSLLCLILVIVMSMFLKALALAGGFVLIVALFFLFREIYHKSIFQRELVQSVTTAKEYINSNDKLRLAKVLDRNQSKTTKRIIKNLKE
ncbi:MAG: hypothetical protein KAX49_12910 [Halanaerobiales bacterium]|nr:hypothetical protein [Halanaerobiales bacterium]